ncbi:MAG: helix-turn-helix domain-containing protein [Gemmataceae bacterium]
MNEDLQYLTTTQAAEILGVSVATIKRWVDSDILPGHKTPGKHRRILRQDVMRLAGQKDFPRLNLETLSGPIPTDSPSTKEEISEEFYAGLLGNDIKRARVAIHGSYQQGISLTVLGDDVISPVMTMIGHDWATGKIDVYQEHRATRICESVLFELKAKLEGTASVERPVALGGSPENDPTVIPSLLVQMVLMDNGWDAVNLGAHTPLASFRRALEEVKPQLLWLSITHQVTNPKSFLKEYAELASVAEKQGAAIALGGRALSPELRNKMWYTTFGDGVTQLANFAKQLHRRPELPKPGRPAANNKEA